jgi:hypothetical protein
MKSLTRTNVFTLPAIMLASAGSGRKENTKLFHESARLLFPGM